MTLKKWTLINLLIVSMMIAAWLMTNYLHAGIDWDIVYRPATQALLAGKSPYEITGMYNAPWTLIPFIPATLLPDQLGNVVTFIMALIGYFVILIQLKVSKRIMIAFLLAPPILLDLGQGNVNWLVLLGFVMPPWIGLFLVLMKPQVGGIVALFWLIEAFRTGGIRQVLMTFLPVTGAFALSFLLYGLWPLKMLSIPYAGSPVNASLFPLSIPIGLALTSLAIRKREARYAWMAAPFFSPYVAISAYGGVFLGLATLSVWEVLTASAGIWSLLLYGRHLMRTP